MNDSINDLYELRVLNGLHQGAALPLVGNQWFIGADDALDLALHDAGVEPMHCQLQREGEHWRLDAVDGKALDSEGHPFNELHPNTQFALGSVWVSLAHANEPWPDLPIAIVSSEGTKPRGEKLSPALNGVRGRLIGRCACITLGILLGVVGSAWSLSTTLLSSEQGQVESVKAPPARIQDSRSSIDLQAAARMLKTMLSERMLNTVSLEHTADGLALIGTLKDDSMLVYERMLQRFNRDHRMDFELEDRVSHGNAGLPFAITQIIGGSNGHLVMANGRRMYIGDRIDGIRLVQIEDGRIHFDGERRMDVAW